MNRLYLVLVFALFCVTFASAQTKSVETMSQQIRALKAEKTISVTHEPTSNSSKLMLVAENFSDDEAGRAGVMAMNFATGFFFSGTELKTAPDKILFTFWIMSKKPRFAADHRLEFTVGNETIAIGESRYAAKANRNMEYLNYEIRRDDFMKIANQTKVGIKIGKEEFSFTRSQLHSLASLMLVSDPTWMK